MCARVLLRSTGPAVVQMGKLLKGGPGKFKENGQQMLMQKMMEQVRLPQLSGSNSQLLGSNSQLLGGSGGKSS